VGVEMLPKSTRLENAKYFEQCDARIRYNKLTGIFEEEPLSEVIYDTFSNIVELICYFIIFCLIIFTLIKGLR
jgi:hypothetical protein